jgi:hypothetical protein
MRLRHILTLLGWVQTQSAKKEDYPTFLRISGSKFSGRYHFVEYSDTNDSPIYKSEELYTIATLGNTQSDHFSDNLSNQSEESLKVRRHTEKVHLYLGKLNGKGIEGWSEPDFWSLNTQQDMFGDYFAQLESSLRVPLYPKNRTELVWKSVYDQLNDFDQFSISVPDNESCTNTDEVCGAAECFIINGNRECLCFHGYSYDYTTKTCLDNNECASQEHQMCVNGETCINTDGSYYCQVGCDGLVEDLEYVSELFINLDVCDGQLEVNGAVFIKDTHSNGFNTGISTNF